MRFEEVLPALRAGKKVRAVMWRADCSMKLVGTTFFDETQEIFHLTSHALIDYDWEVVPEPVKVADYLVPASYLDNYGKKGWTIEIHEIGMQPRTSVLVPDTERTI